MLFAYLLTVTFSVIGDTSDSGITSKSDFNWPKKLSCLLWHFLRHDIIYYWTWRS